MSICRSSATDALDPRSRLIMLYAMCGFANFGSLGIMIGGLGTMAPERREEINSLGLKSIVSGTLTTCLMGAIVGVSDVTLIPTRFRNGAAVTSYVVSSTVLKSAGSMTSSNSTSSE